MTERSFRSLPVASVFIVLLFFFKFFFFSFVLRNARDTKKKLEHHLRGLEPEQHRSEETSQRWRAVGDAVSDLTDP